MNGSFPPVELGIMKNVKAADLAELFRKMAAEIAALEPLRRRNTTEDQIFELITEREKQSSTCLGFGLSLPHVRIPGLDSLCAVWASLSDEIICDTPDGDPVMFGCMLLIPEDQPMEGLRFMSDLAAVIFNPEWRDCALKCGKTSELLSLLHEVRNQRPQTLIASDIMAQPRLTLAPDQPLKEATRLMARSRTPVVPVLKDGILVGEIIADDLFKLGIPDFFSQLKSVGFIRYFEPFEGYFAQEAVSKVSDVMTAEVKTFPPDMTLIEIVFAISVQKCPLLYVADEHNKLLGVVDRTLLLERIINL